MVQDDKWYLMRNDEVAQIPLYVKRTLLQERVVTRVFGPYIFFNNFELTPEATYLKQMLKYRQLTATAQKKVDSIKQRYSRWVMIDTEFEQVLRERDEGGAV